jgi:sugar lactone lactonase YvrE
MTVLMTGITFGESPRWHDGRVWFADWGAHQVVVMDPSGAHEVVARVDSFPMCIDFLPDGRLVVVDSAHRRLLRQEADGSLTTVADLAAISEKPWNDIVVLAGGDVYVNNIGFDFPGGEPAGGLVALVSPDGSARQVADELSFPNGMAVTADGFTLLVAESYANRIAAFDIAGTGDLSGRRVWADAGDDHPDGICIDAGGALWYADVGNRRCVRIREGGEVLQTIDLDRGAFSCTLSRRGEPRLFVTAQTWGGPGDSGPTGQLLAFPAPAYGAGWP